MKTFLSKIADAFFRRSCRNAATSNTGANPAAGPNLTAAPAGPDSSTEPIVVDSYNEKASIAGLDIEYGRSDYTVLTPQKQLHRTRETVSLILGCGHIVDNQTDKQDADTGGKEPPPVVLAGAGQQRPPVRKDSNKPCRIEGICYDCRAEKLSLYRQGLISISEADRLSLVCNHCARMTESGRLCCRRHAGRINLPDGSHKYVDGEEMENINRQQTVARILKPLGRLFGENRSEE